MCFYKNISVDEVEVKVLPYNTISGQESQSQPDSGDDYADGQYLRFVETSRLFFFPKPDLDFTECWASPQPYLSLLW